jgi:hypothetical protein
LAGKLETCFVLLHRSRGRRNPARNWLPEPFGEGVGSDAILGGIAVLHAWRRGATWPLWPGAVRHVQRESVKAAGLFFEQVSTPRLRPVA